MSRPGPAQLSGRASSWRGWTLEEKRAFRDKLARSGWRGKARPEQIPPEDPWTTLFLRGGRGSGKTWAGAHILLELIEEDPSRASEGPGKWAVVAPTFADCRDKCIEGEAGILAALGTNLAEVNAGRSGSVSHWNRSLGELVLRDGSIIAIDGADDGAYRIQGENLRGAWCDEIGLWRRWKTAWDESLAYALRKGEAKRVATGTPKRDQHARALVRRLINDPAVVNRRLRTADNLENLSPAFVEAVVRPTVGTELGRQELEGELLEDVEGALWRRDWIVRGEPPYTWQSKVLALDPADGIEEGDEQAICIAGLGGDWRLYVIHSEGTRSSPTEWLRRAVDLATRHDVGLIVVERNHGGKPLMELLEMVMRERGRRVAYREVTASQGKQTRAEPVAALYEQKRVVHLDDFPELEDQLCSWTPHAGSSPDRLDALVWAMAELRRRNWRGPPEGEDGLVQAWSERRDPAVAAWR